MAAAPAYFTVSFSVKLKLPALTEDYVRITIVKKDDANRA